MYTNQPHSHSKILQSADLKLCCASTSIWIWPDVTLTITWVCYHTDLVYSVFIVLFDRTHTHAHIHTHHAHAKSMPSNIHKMCINICKTPISSIYSKDDFYNSEPFFPNPPFRPLVSEDLFLLHLMSLPAATCLFTVSLLPVVWHVRWCTNSSTPQWIRCTSSYSHREQSQWIR